MKFCKFLYFAFLAVSLISCNFTENLEVKSDGSGEFKLDMDGSGLMAMAGDQLKNMSEEKGKERIDSIIYFKDILEAYKDSISKLSKEEQAQVKNLENVVMHLKMDADKKELFATLNSPFKNCDNLGNILGSLKKLNELKGNQEKAAMPMPTNDIFGDANVKLSFAYDGKKFSRKAQKISPNVKKEETDSLGVEKMFFASSTYTLKYHFHKPVKKVSNPNALFSEDRKTITVQYPFSDYKDNPEKLNLDIEFEK